MAHDHLANARRVPTRTEALVFRGKTLLLQGRRFFVDALDAGVRRAQKGSKLADSPVIATSHTPLWTETEPEERFLVAGKIQNLRLAVKHLDGLEFDEGQTFSFWRQVGRASRFKGYVKGRELREGCIIPNIGGGLCQISNALYDAALEANFEIVERHAHSQVVTGSLAEKGRDATVFWNYVDLRFRSHRSFRIEARLDDKELVVTFRGHRQASERTDSIRRIAVHNDTPRSCATCEMDCHRVIDPIPQRDFGRTAFLVDEFSPEFDDHIQRTRTGKDLMLVPMDGKRFGKANYAWTNSGFGRLKQSLLVTALRSYRSRKLSAQGRSRQVALLKTYRKLAHSFAGRLDHEVLNVVVHQNLLPFLWESGDLGGRSFDVLMTALPMAELQKRLDRAAELYPESTTLGDFRADERLVAAEAEALRHARRIVTQHTEIASLFGDRSDLLPWNMPVAEQRTPPQNAKPHLIFPASTVGRKGCYELRDALRGKDVKLVLLGPQVEGEEFWKGFDTTRGGDDWIASADLVILPAHVEHKPRRLLIAAAAGIPVIASPACGVGNVPGITVVGTDPVELRSAIDRALAG